MFQRLLNAEEQDETAKTVEVFGWIVLVEGAVIMFLPHFVASVLHLPPLIDQGANYFRLAALLLLGIGMLYIVSGRLNSQGFAFASLLDRPLVPPTMAVLWWLNIVPGPLALAFSIQDLAGFVWTLRAWRAEQGRT
jgi:hypothetical protein